MKAAIKNTAVYSKDGDKVIGTLEPGDLTLALGELDGDIIIAYVVGRIKEPGSLVEADEWHETVSAVDKFIAYVSAQEGCLYVWGAQGQTMTPELIRRLENSDKNYRRALAQYEDHAAKGLTLIGYDCSGLVVAYLLREGLIGYDTTANGLYASQCTPIGKDHLRAGDLVFKKYRTKNKMYHVGVYMGDGSVVHAKGRDDGVVRESLSATGWNRFGRLQVFDNTGGTVAFTRNLRRVLPNMRGDDVRAVQAVLLDKGFDPGGIDGLYGKNTVKAVIAYQQASGLEADGIVGPITWASLMGS